MSRVAVRHWVAENLEALTDLPIDQRVSEHAWSQEQAGSTVLTTVYIPRQVLSMQTDSQGRPIRSLGGYAGNRKREYTLNVVLIWADGGDSEVGGQKFDAQIDCIEGALRALVVPAEVTDPDTGVVTHVISIADDIDIEATIPTYQQDSGLMFYTADIQMIVREIFTG
jgi:hypothetical protein